MLYEVITISVVVFILCFVVFSCETESFFGSFFASLALTCVCFFMCLAIITDIDHDKVKKEGIEESNSTIISLHINQFSNGSFFIGCGNIKSEEKYILMKKSADGGMNRIYLPVKETTIYMDEDVNPYYTTS